MLLQCITAAMVFFSLLAPAAAGDAPDCSSVVLSMIDCLDYVTAGSNVSAPSESCCSGVASVVKESPLCLCDALKRAVDMGVAVNMTRADALPTSCSIHATTVHCGNNLVAPSPAPIPTPVPVPVPTPTPTPPPPPPPAPPKPSPLASPPPPHKGTPPPPPSQAVSSPPPPPPSEPISPTGPLQSPPAGTPAPEEDSTISGASASAASISMLAAGVLAAMFSPVLSL